MTSHCIRHLRRYASVAASTAIAWYCFVVSASGIDSGIYSNRVDLSAPRGQVNVELADIDGDGKPDAITANYHAGTISLFRNVSPGGVVATNSFAPQVDFSSGARPTLVRAADVDGDGKLDLVVLNSQSATISIFRNVSSPGNLTTNSFVARIDVSTPSDPRYFAIADFDADGKLDLAVATWSSSRLSLYPNLSQPGSAPSFGPRVDLSTTVSSISVEPADFDGDGRIDIALANLSGGTVAVFRNIGTGPLALGSFAGPTNFTAGPGCSLAIGDVDGDGRVDMVTPNQFANTLSVLRNTSINGVVAFAPKVDFAAGAYPYSAVLVDVDRDGRLDIAVANTTSSTLSLYQNISSVGSFVSNSLASRFDLPVGPDPRLVSTADLDGDQWPDLVIGIFEAAYFTILQNTPPIPSVVAFDLSRDFSANQNPSGVWLYGWAESLHGPVTRLTVPVAATAENSVVMPSWRLTSYQTPAVACNTNTNAAFFEHEEAQASSGDVWFFPGDNDQPEKFGVIRFVAPISGNFQIVASASPIYSGSRQGDTDFHVVLNGVSLHDQWLSGSQGATFTGIVALGANEPLDFVIGNGADGLQNGSGLRIAAQFTQTTNAPTVAPHSGEFSLAGDFSSAANPSGVWTYGWSGTVGSTFTKLTVPHSSTAENGVQVPSWQLTSNQGPAVFLNNTTNRAVFQYGTGYGDPGEMWYFPGENGRPENYGVIRFTAPSNGNYEVTAAVSPVYPVPGQGDTDFHVVVNGFAVLDEWLSGSQGASYTGVVALAANGTLDFVIGRGADGRQNESGLKIAALLAATTNSPTVVTNPPPETNVVFSLVRDFSIASNPNGVWTYGHTPTIGGAFTKMAVARNDAAPSFPIWTWSVTGNESPHVAFNASATETFYANGGVFPPKTLWVAPGHPSSTNSFGVMRFTAPTSGVYFVEAAAESYIGAGSGDTDYHVLKNGVELFSYFLPAGAQQSGYTNSLTLTTGETVDFVVGRGADGLLTASELKLKADLTLLDVLTNPPPPAAFNDFNLARDFSSGANPSGVWTYGWSGTVGDTVTKLTVPHTSTTDNGVQVPSWQLTSYQTPAVYYNNTTNRAVFQYGTAYGDPGEMWYFPGENGRPENYGVIRFTAPSNGNYEVTAAVTPVYPLPGQGDTDFHVVKGGLSILDRWLSGNQGASYTGVVALAAQETVDFVIGRGADGRQDASGLKISAVVVLTTNAPTPLPPPPPLPSEYVMGRDFMTGMNPSGAWGFGWSATVGGEVTSLTIPHTSMADNGVAIPSWQFTSYQTPAVYWNNTTNRAVFQYGTGFADPGDVWFYPGENNRPENYGVIRFTAPTNGNYSIDASVKPVYPAESQGDTDFHVVKNGSSLLERWLSGSQGASYTGVVALAANETLDFVIGRGVDARQNESGLKIAATICPTTNAPTPPPPPPEPDYDVARDFSPTNNPNLPWAFGWQSELGGTFSHLTVHRTSAAANGVAVPSWQLTASSEPAVFCNTSSVAASIPPLQIAPGTLWFSAGQNGAVHNFGVIRFTAPVAGSYRIIADARPFFPPASQGDSDFHVLKNGTELFGRPLALAEAASFSNVLALVEGDTVDFVVGRGADGSLNNSVLKLATAIYVTPDPAVPPPPPVMNDFNLGRDFVTTQNTNGVWTHGWSASVGGVVTPLSVAHTSTADNGVPIPSWQLTSYQTPAVYWNNTTNRAAFQYGTAYADPGEVWFYPGENGRPENFGVIRFTAPSNANYMVSAHAYRVYPTEAQGDTDFHIVKNGVSLFDRWLSANQSVTHTGVVALVAGDTLDFVIGRGADGRQNESGLKLAAVLNPTTNAPTPPPLPPPASLTFDLSEDFSTTLNPCAPWAFGWKSELSGSYSNLTVRRTSVAANGVVVASWQLTLSEAPAVFCNTSGVAASIPPVQAESGAVWFSAGQNGAIHNYGVIRFTAPTNGMYEVVSEVLPFFTVPSQGDTDFHVLKNDVELFGEFLAGTESASYSNMLALTAGDTIDFAVGRGADGNQNNSVLKISASVRVVSASAPIVRPPVRITSGFTRVSDNEVEVSIAGASGSTYVIEASSDLVTWTTVTTVENTSAIIRFSDPVAATSPSRFYRAWPVNP